MTTISNPSAPGAPTQVAPTQPVRDPIGGVAFTNRVTNPAVAIFPTTTITPIPNSVIDAAGRPMNRR